MIMGHLILKRRHTEQLGFNPYSYKAYFNVKGVDGASASDGVHPKQTGRQLRADRIIGQLEALY
jgi:lysophospholipase L1-like esterase